MIDGDVNDDGNDDNDDGGGDYDAMIMLIIMMYCDHLINSTLLPIQCNCPFLISVSF